MTMTRNIAILLNYCWDLTKYCCELLLRPHNIFVNYCWDLIKYFCKLLLRPHNNFVNYCWDRTQYLCETLCRPHKRDCSTMASADKEEATRAFTTSANVLWVNVSREHQIRTHTILTCVRPDRISASKASWFDVRPTRLPFWQSHDFKRVCFQKSSLAHI